MLITTENLREWDIPYNKELYDKFEGKGLTPLQVLDLENIHFYDRTLILFRKSVIPPKELRLLACDFADVVVTEYENEHPNNTKLRESINKNRKFPYSKEAINELYDMFITYNVSWVIPENIQTAMIRKTLENISN